MTKKTILLVGNGPSMIGSRLSTEIDSFAQVVRFNNFQLEDYKADVGTKATILARRSCDDVTLHSPDLFESVLNFVTYCRWTAGMLAVSRQIASFYGDKCVTVSSGACRLIGMNIGLDQPNVEWASIGVLAIGYLLQSYDVLHICGFDHLKADDSGIVHHYFPKKPKDAKCHNAIKEKAYVERLIQDQKVVRL